jgi:ketosteroid isomerase-like protein
MIYRIFIPLLLLCTGSLHAQSDNDWAAVKQPIEQLFNGMRAADSTAIRTAFMPNATLYTTLQGRDGNPMLQQGSLDDFVKSIGRMPAGMLDEQLQGYDIRIDGMMATAWTPYRFYVNKELSHCGTNAFQLFKSAEGWKIAQVMDTRYKEGCETESSAREQAIKELLNQWHNAAATADAEGFFGKMTADAIYLGTDASERWLRDELREWAAFAFEREVAWAFKPYDRQLYFSMDGQTAWFEEMLDTENMGVCRGSGVLSLTANGWKIRHYDLSLMVPNEKMPDFQQLLKEK